MPILSSLISSLLQPEKPGSGTTQAQLPSSQTPSDASSTPTPTPPSSVSQIQAQIPTRPQAPESQLSPLQRQVKQLSLFMLGAGCMAASVAITRRSVIRMQREAFPRFFSASNNPGYVDSADRSFLAVQAFGLATLNVSAFAVMMTGGLAWGFDLCSLGELRDRTQEALRRPTGEGMFNEKEEKELEQMMTDLMQKLGMDPNQVKKE